MKYFYLLIYITFSISKLYSQTCVIGKVIDGNIYVGADSRQTRYVSTVNGIDSIPIVTCKIHTLKNFCFVNIGNFPDEAYEIAAKLCKENATFQTVFILFINQFKEKALLELEKFQTNHPLLYKRITGDSILSQLLFFGYEGDSLVFESIVFRAKADANGKITIYSQIIPAVEGYIAGEIKEIKSLFEDEEIWEYGPVAVIDALMGIAANANKKTVALPVDIICVNKNSIRWIRRKKVCKN